MPARHITLAFCREMSETGNVAGLRSRYQVAAASAAAASLYLRTARIAGLQPCRRLSLPAADPRKMAPH